ncbi:MAG: PAS domain S-box protein [Geobacteraceae bacterium]|nr:PAS domain S-box protein [Geobacteraceae bacterium]
MNRYIAYILLFMVILATAEPLTANASTRQKVRIAAFNFYPTLFQDKDGAVKGFYVDFLREIAQRENWDIEFVYGNWVDGLARIQSGEVDVLPNVAFTPERAQFMDYGKVPLLTVWAELYVPEGAGIENIRDLNGKMVALMKGDFNAANFKNLVEKFSIPCRIAEYNNYDEVFKAVANRQADGGIVNNTFGAAKQNDYRLKSSGVIFNPFDIFFTVAKGQNAVILAKLDQYLGEWRKSENSPYHRARERWAHGTASTIRVNHPWMINTAVGLAALLCITAVFLFILRIEVRRKTIALANAMEEAESLQRLYSGTFDNTFQFLGLLTPDGRLVNANKASLDLIDADKESVVGALFWETPWWAHDPDEQQRLKDAIEMCGKGEILHFETTHQDLMGNLHYVDFSLKPLRDNSGAINYIIPEGRDVTQYKTIQNDLMQREQELQSLFMTAPIGIAYVKDRVFSKVNTAYAALYGYSQEELIGKSTRILYASENDYLEAGKEIYAQAAAKGTATVEVRTVSKCGAFVDILLGIAPVSTGDLSAGFVSSVLDVTEKKKAFVALEESEKRFQAMFDESPMIMGLYDALTGAYVDFNKSFCDVHGITRDAIGMRPDEAGVVSSEEFQRVFEIYSRQGSIDQIEMKAVGKGGAAIDLLFSANTIELSGKKYALGVSQNITDRILAEQRLMESETKYRNLFENAPIGIFQSVPAGRFLAVNGVCAELFGYSSPKDMIEGVTDITNELYVDPAQRSHILEQLKLCNSVTTNDVQARRKDGSIIYIDLHMRAVRESAVAVEMLEGFLVDVTERKKTEELVLQSEKLSMVAGMAAGIAHEVNNPLGIIAQDIQNLERRFSTTLPANRIIADEIGLDLEQVELYMEQRDISNYIASMRSAVKRASGIILNMLQFSRQSDATHQFLNLNDVIEQSIILASNDYDLKKKYDFKHISIVRNYCNNLPVISISITEIEQAFINLLKNAAQAMFTANTEKPTITITTSLNNGFVVATVNDNGPGMSVEVQRKIFDPFFTTKEIGVGTGLGLSVTYTIITKNHNGEFTVESEPGAGASFTIRLPLPS